MDAEADPAEDDDLDEPTNNEDDDLPSLPFPPGLVAAMDLSPEELDHLRRTGEIPEAE